MLHINTLTKKALEKIIIKIFKILGPFRSSQVLDSLKLLGFSYATASGISINIEDLKVPAFKENSLKKISKDISIISKNWKKGKLTEIERFASIINNWSITSEILKNKIINYFRNFEPTNNLYIMAFSGARGSIDQVHQIVGIRGLMSDQKGEIIDLPIRNNFREGLSPIDYVISSYGARKGIVDTALKTASSGYLTRRLVYVAQDLIIRKFDCNTKIGIFLFINKKLNLSDIKGRILLSIMPLKLLAIQTINKNIYLNETILSHLINIPALISIRSPLTCKIKNSICQSCYGWNFAKNKLINLGDAVGIIAAHSLGEPATQLTMRTFQTGGIFTNESLKQVIMPFSGIVELPIIIKKNISKNFFGTLSYRIPKSLIITITNWEGQKKSLLLESGSILNIIKTKFLQKDDIISECPINNNVFITTKKTPIYSSITGELHIVEKRKKSKAKRIFSKKIVLIKSGKILITPNNIFFNYSFIYKINKPLASLNITCPIDGFFLHNKQEISIVSKEKKITIKFFNFYNFVKNYKTKLFFYLWNYQFLDKHTTLGIFNIYFHSKESLYKIKKLRINSINSIINLLITKNDTWKITLDQNINKINKFVYKLPNLGITINQIIKSGISGFLIKKNGDKLLYQKQYSIDSNKKVNLKTTKNLFIFKNKLLFNLLNPAQATLDITQGLPKLEGIFEARYSKKKLLLAEWPGISIFSNPCEFFSSIKFTRGLISYNIGKIFKETLLKELKLLKIFHTKYNYKNIIFYRNTFWEISLLAKGFFPIMQTNTFNFKFIKNEAKLCALVYIHSYQNEKKDNFKKLIYKWELGKINKNYISNYKNTNIEGQEMTNKNYFKDVSYYYFNTNFNDLIFNFQKNKYIYLKDLNYITEYAKNYIYSKSIRLGSFIDIAEPISLFGSLDARDMLNILFKYHIFLDGIIKGTLKSVNKFQLILVNSIQAIYQLQNIEISSKNIDIIIRQLTNKVKVLDIGNTPYISGEIFPMRLILEIIKIISLSKNFKAPTFHPQFFSSINASLNKSSILTSASFQQAKKLLSKGALYGKADWLIGLKERIITGGYISSGSTFLNNTKNLDMIYLFKKE